MFTPEMLASVKKVEATRQERLGMELRRMTAEEKDALLKAYHPDYREDGFDTIKIGPNKGEKVPKELGHLLHSNSRLLHHPIDLTKIDYDTDVLIIGGGGAGARPCTHRKDLLSGAGTTEILCGTLQHGFLVSNQAFQQGAECLRPMDCSCGSVRTQIR